MAAWIITAIAGLIIAEQPTAEYAMKEMIPASVIGAIISVIGVIFTFTKNSQITSDKAHQEVPELEIAKNMPKGLSETHENKYYEQAWAEIESNNLNKSLWAKSFSECDGDSDRVKAKYISLRVAELRADEEKRCEQKQIQKQETHKNIDNELDKKSFQENNAAKRNVNDNSQEESNIFGNVMLLLGVGFIVAIGWVIMSH